MVMNFVLNCVFFLFLFAQFCSVLCRSKISLQITLYTGAVECVNCIYGALTATHCTCVAGTYRVSETTCKECKEGRYTPHDNMLECLECAGKVTEDHKCECPGHMKLVDDVCVRNYCTPGQKKVKVKTMILTIQLKSNNL